MAQFPEKLFQILSDADNFNAIAWVPGGTAFQVKDRRLLEGVVLPKYFRHAKLTSFQRQLSLYGIKRRMASDDAYSHPLLIEGHAHLVPKIRRKSKNGGDDEQDGDEQLYHDDAAAVASLTNLGSPRSQQQMQQQQGVPERLAVRTFSSGRAHDPIPVSVHANSATHHGGHEGYGSSRGSYDPFATNVHAHAAYLAGIPDMHSIRTHRMASKVGSDDALEDVTINSDSPRSPRLLGNFSPRLDDPPMIHGRDDDDPYKEREAGSTPTPSLPELGSPDKGLLNLNPGRPLGSIDPTDSQEDLQNPVPLKRAHSLAENSLKHGSVKIVDAKTLLELFR